MAKGRKSRDALAEQGAGGKEARRIARLEDRLGRVQAKAAATQIRLDELKAREATIRERLAALRATGSAGAEAAAVPDPMGYCMREKLRVPIANAKPVVLANGRHALSGTCVRCGAGVVAIVAGPPAAAVSV
jgi:Domain of unknown function (DUF5679)